MTFQSYKRKLWQFLLLIKTVITWSKILPYLIHLNKQILNQYTKTIPGKNRKITVLSVSYKTYLKVMSIASIHRWKSTLILFILYINLDLEMGRNAILCTAIFTYYDWKMESLEKWITSLDQNRTCVVLLTDLSKGFHCEFWLFCFDFTIY